MPSMHAFFAGSERERREGTMERTYACAMLICALKANEVVMLRREAERWRGQGECVPEEQTLFFRKGGEVVVWVWENKSTLASEPGRRVTRATTRKREQSCEPKTVTTTS